MPNQSPDNRVGQVQVIPFRKDAESGDWQVLMLQRNAEKGGFWQPVTGGIEPGEKVPDAALREAGEELGIVPDDCADIINNDYTFVFTDMHRGIERTFTEHVLAIVLRDNAAVKLSTEHVAMQWADRQTALSLLKYASNKNSLRHYWKTVTGEDSDDTD